MDQCPDPGSARPSQSWRPSPLHAFRLHRAPPSVTCTPKRAGVLEGSPPWTSWKGRMTMPPPPLLRLLSTATPTLATTLLLWMPTDHPLMAVFSPWAAGPPVLLCSCPLALDSAPLCTRPATTIWKPPLHPSTGEGTRLFFTTTV